MQTNNRAERPCKGCSARLCVRVFLDVLAYRTTYTMAIVTQVTTMQMMLTRPPMRT